MCVRFTSTSVGEIFTFEFTNYEDIGREWNKRDVFDERLVELFEVSRQIFTLQETRWELVKIGIFKDESIFPLSSGVHCGSFMMRVSHEKHILHEINRIV